MQHGAEDGTGKKWKKDANGHWVEEEGEVTTNTSSTVGIEMPTKQAASTGGGEFVSSAADDTKSTELREESAGLLANDEVVERHQNMTRGGGEGTTTPSATAIHPYGGVHHNYLATTVQGPVMGQIVHETYDYSGFTNKEIEHHQMVVGRGMTPWKVPPSIYTPFVYNEGTAVSSSPCRICKKSDQPETLFEPCNCTGMVHRHCFRTWRAGWINPRNYFACPHCMYKYNMEQIKPSTVDSEEKIRRNFRVKLFKLLFTVFLAYGLMVFLWAGFTYLCDTSEKNIPVAVKYMLTSAVTGIPDTNTTTMWEANFKREDVRVWPYYTMFGVLLTSIIILIVFASIGCTFDKKEYRSNRRCCEDCCDGTGATCYLYQPCPGDCHCDCCLNSNPCAGCSGGGGGGGCDLKCDGGGAQFLIILLLVLIVAVIVSAVFVVIFFTLQKSALLYDRMSAMILNQQKELEGETIVLGKNESWRPLNAV